MCRQGAVIGHPPSFPSVRLAHVDFRSSGCIGDEGQRLVAMPGSAGQGKHHVIRQFVRAAPQVRSVIHVAQQFRAGRRRSVVPRAGFRSRCRRRQWLLQDRRSGRSAPEARRSASTSAAMLAPVLPDQRFDVQAERRDGARGGIRRLARRPSRPPDRPSIGPEKRAMEAGGVGSCAVGGGSY